jgi:hypothetical protein
MYPPVRQFESSELHRYLVEKDAEPARSRRRRLGAPQGAWVVMTAVPLLVGCCILAALLIGGFAG